MRFFSVLLLVSVTSLAMACMAAEDGLNRALSYPVPESPSAVLVSMHFKGGFGPAPDPKALPALVVRADGKVIVGQPGGKQQSVTAQLSKEEVQSLLFFIIKQQGFFKQDNKALADSIMQEKQKGGPVMAVADAVTTEIRVCTADQDQTVSVYALGMNAQQLPGVAGLAGVHAIEQRLQQVRAGAIIGNEQDLAALLQEVNAAVQKKFPDAEDLAGADLRTAWRRADDALYAHFTRASGDDKAQVTLNATITKPKRGDADIRVHMIRPGRD